MHRGFRYGIPMMVVYGLLQALAPARAQVDVRGGGKGKASMDWSGFTAGGGSAAAEFVQTLQADLARSGWFIQAGRGAGEYVLQGQCAPAGGGLQAQCILTERATNRALLRKAFSGGSSGARTFAHQVADEITKAAGHKGMASGRFVFVGTQSGKKELYLADADGRGLRQLTQDKSTSVAPKWGPGNQVVYTSFLKGHPDVYRINLTSGQRNAISSYAGLNTGADLSPDGKDVALVLSKDGNPELYIKNLASGRLSRITKTRESAEASPSWSPDGQRIVYVSDSSGRPNLYIVSRQGGRAKRLTAGRDENVAPEWGADGRIVYCARQAGKYRIVWMDPAKGNSETIPVPDAADYEDPSWAPDQRHIACTRTANYRSQVYLLDTMGDGPIALTDYRGDWYSPSWAP